MAVKKDDAAIIDSLISANLALTNVVALLNDQIMRLSEKTKVEIPDLDKIQEAFQINNQFQQQMLTDWNQQHPDDQYDISFGEPDNDNDQQ
ncbi:MAG: hypothetical protein LKG31_03355 [Lactobacillus sp.]|nr:hypothetical protein [Lactobacillus sp.]